MSSTDRDKPERNTYPETGSRTLSGIAKNCVSLAGCRSWRVARDWNESRLTKVRRAEPRQSRVRAEKSDSNVKQPGALVLAAPMASEVRAVLPSRHEGSGAPAGAVVVVGARSAPPSQRRSRSRRLRARHRGVYGKGTVLPGWHVNSLWEPLRRDFARLSPSASSHSRQSPRSRARTVTPASRDVLARHARGTPHPAPFSRRLMTAPLVEQDDETISLR